jgi:hypothetical protein
MLTFSSTECGQLVHTVRSSDLPQNTLRTSQKYGPRIQNLPLETPPETTGVQRFARVHGRHRKQFPRELIATDLTRDPMSPFNHVPSTNKRPTNAEGDHTFSSSSSSIVIQPNSNYGVDSTYSGVSIPRAPSPSHSRVANSRPSWASRNNFDLEQEENRISQWIEGVFPETEGNVQSTSSSHAETQYIGSQGDELQTLPAKAKSENNDRPEIPSGLASNSIPRPVRSVSGFIDPRPVRSVSGFIDTPRTWFPQVDHTLSERTESWASRERLLSLDP